MRWTKDNGPVSLPPLPPLPEVVATAPAAALPPIAVAPAIEEPVAPTASSAPVELDLRPDKLWRDTAEIAELLSRAGAATRDIAGSATYPLAAWNQFRRDHAVRPPPGLPRDPALVVVIDAVGASPFRLRETLSSLRAQSVQNWRAIVVAGPDLIAHPVASFADFDDRFRFCGPAAFASPDGEAAVVTAAGVRLDPEALAWFDFAAVRTGAEAAFCDHDHAIVDPDLGPLHADPWLYGALDVGALGWTPVPAVVGAGAGLVARVAATFGTDDWRRDLLAAAERATHIARPLASLVEMPIAARTGRESLRDGAGGFLGPGASRPPVAIVAPSDTRIAIAMPTRDGAEMLERAIATMRRTARNAARLDIVVVDNRSVQPATAALLERLEAAGEARRLAFDQPFNWGLASNAGARASDAPLIVFANNDLEMLSPGWDDRLVEAFADPAVGCLGARLLYPNRTIQHGGVVFGMTPWHVEHEGRGAAASDPGPHRRLVTPRNIASVTGAFLAVRREDFEAVGGIDVDMGVAHSDVDFCLKLRERGLVVRYEPRIEAIHYESMTRGMNSTKADIAWDESERAELGARWGSSLREDVGVSPYWCRTGALFGAILDPSLVEVVRHIDRTGRRHPWLPSRREAQEAAAWHPEAIG